MSSKGECVSVYQDSVPKRDSQLQLFSERPMDGVI